MWIFKKNNKYLPADLEEYKKMKNKPLLFVRNLTKKYPGRKKPAIQNLSIDVYSGQFHAFIGANGAGKTTTIKSLIGAYANWNGTILINGIENNKEECKRKIGYIPENARFPEKFSAFKYLVWMCRLNGKTKKQSYEIAEEHLKKLNMWNVKNKSPNTFSSGQKKKILLAQALVHNPDIIIMDEPAANLDPKARSEFFSSLMKLKKEGKAIFISSHILAEIDKYADSATILDGGKIIFSGGKCELMKFFNTNKWICNTSNNKKFIKLLNYDGFKHQKENENIIVIVENENKFDQLQKKLTKNNIYFTLLVKCTPTLQDIYDKLIIKGSVDTM